MGQPTAKMGDQVAATNMHLFQPLGRTSLVLVPYWFTCNDLVDTPAGTAVAVGTVRIGG